MPQHIQSFITGATFSTLTNVNFDEARFVHMLQQATDYSAELKQKLAAAGGGALVSLFVSDGGRVPSFSSDGEWERVCVCSGRGISQLMLLTMPCRPTQGWITFIKCRIL